MASLAAWQDEKNALTKIWITHQTIWPHCDNSCHFHFGKTLITVLYLDFKSKNWTTLENSIKDFHKRKIVYKDLPVLWFVAFWGMPTLQIFTDDLQKTICKIVFHVVFAHYILRFCIFHWKYRKIYAVIIYYCGWILNIDLIYVIHIEINYSAFTKGEILEKPVIRFLNFFLFPASMTF